MSTDSIRAFIAVALPDALKLQLADLEKQLKRRCPDAVKWVEPESMHLTLVFLGYTTEDKIEEIKFGIEEAVSDVKSFRLSVKNVGAFPNLNRVQVIWVGIQGTLDVLAGIQQRVAQNMEQLGFPMEERAFSPHLTLGRIRNYTSPEDRRKIGVVLSETTFESTVNVEVNEINLMQSKLTPSGAIYTKLSSTPLKS